MDTCRLETTLLKAFAQKLIAHGISRKLVVKSLEEVMEEMFGPIDLKAISICPCMKSVKPGTSGLVLDVRRVVHGGPCVNYAEALDA